MPKRIIFKNQDNLAIVIPSPSALKKGRTLDEITIKAIKEVGLPAETEYEIVDTSSIPSDRTFRGAWVNDGKIVKVDMPRARVIHMDSIRRIRNDKLDETDKELLRIIEKGEDTISIKDIRQRLRNIPQDFDLGEANTPEELKALWPEGLKRNEH